MSKTPPNTACTRLVGVCAFSGTLRGLKLVPSKWRCLVPPRRINWRSHVEITSGSRQPLGSSKNVVNRDMPAKTIRFTIC